jgi:hypothetical protein
LIRDLGREVVGSRLPWLAVMEGLKIKKEQKSLPEKAFLDSTRWWAIQDLNL